MRPSLIAIGALAHLLVLGAPRVPAQGGNHCIECHSKEAAAEAARPHARAGISCVDCHGGDASKADKLAAKAQGTGYKGKIARKKLPSLCGDCHADVRRMNPFGLPTDQLAQYRTSRHGVAVLEEDETRAATCVDCHGYHGVVGRRDSASPVHPKNVPTTCSKCHSNKTLTEDIGLTGGEEIAYKKSVHHKLLVEGDLSAPQCATCHGNHGAVPPGFKNVGSVCGKCHIREHELFEKSPHARLVAAGQFDSCVVCHSNHDVQPAGEYILENACKLCHEAGDNGFKVRDALLKQIRDAENSYDKTKAALKEAMDQGFGTPDEVALLEQAHTDLIAMRAQQHALDGKLLANSAEMLSSKLARITERIKATESIERLKRLWLLPVIFFLTLMSFVSWLRYRRIHATPHPFGSSGEASDHE